MSDALLKRLGLLRDRVSALVEARSAGDPTAGEPLRGLYVSAERVEHLLEGRGRIPVQLDDAYGGAGAETDDVLAELAAGFGLTLLDTHILLTALAPDVDRDFEPLYGYLNDDVGRRRASVALALDLAGLAPHDRAARARFHPGAPLVASGLLALEDAERPLPGRGLRVPERVIAHLLGDAGLDGELLGAVELLTAEQQPAGPFASRLGALLAARDAMVHLRGRGAESGAAVEALRAAGLPVLRYDPAYGDQHLVPVLLREARLRGAGVVVGPLPEQAGALVRALESGGLPRHTDPSASGAVPVVLFGTHPFDPRWSADGDVLCLDAPPGAADTGLLWEAELGRDAEEFDLPAAVAPYRLAPEQIRRAARSARTLAVLEGGPLTAAHVQRGARQQSAPALDRHARRVSPAVGWADLVLPAGPREQLEELVVRARQRERVLGQWGLRTGGGRGHGVVALFAGDSGTGKTLAAEVVAGELGVDLYVVDLSAVVDKYVGETEKNLERIFTEADRTDAVLLFDEADAVFGKRSEVKDSHDRYANLESAYLLQRLEAFDGIVLLTTNLRSNIDDAFTRRLDLVIDFPFPEASLRAELWRQCLASAPCALGLDLDAQACAYELSGGAIRSAAVTAAYLAAARPDGRVTAEDVTAGARREYRKMGRLVLPSGRGTD